MIRLAVAVTLLATVALAQTFTPALTSISFSTGVNKVYAGNAFTATITGASGSLSAMDQFAFVAENHCEKAGAGSSLVQPATVSTFTSSSSVVVSWTAAQVPTTTTATNGLLRLCWWSQLEGSWRYYGTYRNLNLRIVAVTNVSRMRFWDLTGLAASVPTAPTVTLTGVNLIADDKILYEFRNFADVNAPCKNTLSTASYNMAGTSGTSATLADFRIIDTPAGGAVFSVSLCWRPAEAITTIYDTTMRVSATVLTTRNAISFIFPTVVLAGTGGIARLRVAGWNIHPEDRFGYSTSACGATVPSASNTVVAVADSSTTANSGTTGYSTWTVDFGSSVSIAGTTYTAPTAIAPLYLCYYIAGSATNAPGSTSMWTSGATNAAPVFLRWSDLTNLSPLADFILAPNDVSNDKLVIPRGYASQAFMRGGVQNGDVFDFRTSACSTTPPTKYTIADASWPFVAIAAADYPSIATGVTACIYRGTTYLAATATYDVIDATGSTVGTNAYTIPTPDTNAAKWFMAGWKTTTGGPQIAFTGMSDTTNGLMRVIPVTAATPTDAMCFATQSRATIQDSITILGADSMGNLRPFYELNIGTTAAPIAYGGGSAAEADVSTPIVFSFCHRIRTAAGATSWIANAHKMTQQPNFAFFPNQLSTLATSLTTPPITVTGVAASGDSIAIWTAAPTLQANTRDCPVAAPSVPTALTRATGTTGVSNPVTFTTAATGFTGANAAMGICAVRTGDSRAYYMTAPAVGLTLTIAGAAGAQTFASYAAQPVTVSGLGTSFFNVANTINIAPGTDCSATPAASATLTNKVTYTSNPNGYSPASAGAFNAATITYPVSASLAYPVGTTNLCRNVGATSTANGGFRVVSLTNACNAGVGASIDGSNAVGASGCVATVPVAAVTAGNGRGFKIANVGSYYISGSGVPATNPSILFDCVNCRITSDALVFSSSATVAPLTAVTGAPVLGVDPTTAAATTMRVAANAAGLFQDALAGQTIDTAAGGVYTAYYKAQGASYFSTGQTFVIIKITGRYPGSAIQADLATPLFLEAMGLDVDAGDAFFGATSGDCNVAVLPTAATAAVSVSAKITFTAADATAGISAQYRTTVGPSTGTTTTWNALCYRPSNQPTSLNFKNIFPATYDFKFFAAAGDRVLPSVLATTIDANNFYMLEGKTATVTVTAAANGGATANNDYKPAIVFSADATCDNSIGASTVGTTTALTKRAATYAGSDFTVMVPLLSASTSAGLGVYGLCYTAKKTTPATTDFTRVPTFTIVVKPIPTLNTANGNVVVIRGAAAAATTQNIDFTVTSTIKLGATDSVCLVIKGAAAPTGAQTSTGGAVSRVNVAGTVSYYCVQAGLNGANQVANFAPYGTGVTQMPAGEYDIYVNAGTGTAVSDVRSTPSKITGSVFVVEPVVRPHNVMQTTGTDQRTVYVDTESVGGNIAFGTCPATGATTGFTSGISAAVKSTFTTAGVNTICFQSKRDLTVPANRLWIPLAQVFTVRTATANHLASPFGTKVHAGAATPLNFPFTTSIAQATDVFRVLAFKPSVNGAAIPNQAACSTSVAADTLSDVTMVGEFAPANIADSSITSGTTPLNLPAQSSYYAADGLRELTGCWLQKTTSPGTAFEAFPTNPLLIRVVDVSSFVVGSAMVNPLANTIPRTMTAEFADWVFLNGRWIDNDDFASFVRVTATDCSKAWTYENAIVGASAPAVNDKLHTKSFGFYLEAGVRFGGLYNLCYFSAGTITGYRLYNAATDAKLRVIDTSVSPRFASNNVATTFTLTQILVTGVAAPAMASLTTADRAAFTAAATNCGTLVGVPNGIPQNLSATSTFSATLNASTSATYDVCIDALLAAGNNIAASPNAIPANGNIGASKKGGVTSYVPAGDYSVYHVTVFATARLLGVSPVTVLVNTPTDVAFLGSGLSLQDSANVTQDSACTNTSVPTTSPFTVAGPSGTSVTVPRWTAAATGTWNICYKPNGASSLGFSDHGVTIAVVGVTSAAPTGSVGALTADVAVTLTGFINVNTARLDGDMNYVGLVARDISGAVKDCRNLNTNNVVTAVATATTLVATLTSAMASGSANEYAYCVHFAGMPWANPANPATDYVLLNPLTLNFNVRGITSFAPATIVNGATQTIRFMGAGIRDFDSFVPVAATAADPSKDCAAAVTASPASQLHVINQAVSGIWPVGTYKLCYGFNTTSALQWVFASNNILTVEAFQVKTLVAPSPAVGDVGANLRVTLSGTGLANLDSARLVNISALAPPSNCETGAGSPYYRVWNTAATPANWNFDVPAGDVPAGTSYGICYKSGTLGTLPANPTVLVLNTTAFTIVYGAPASRLTGFAPSMVMARPADNRVNFFFSGLSLNANDAVSITTGPSTCATVGTPTVVTLSATQLAGRSVANATLTIPGTTSGAYTLCYFYKGAGVGVPSVFTVNAAPGSCPIAGQRFICAGVCSASPCAPSTAAAGPLNSCVATPNFVRCPAISQCLRSVADCAIVADALAQRGLAPEPIRPGQVRCFDGSVADQIPLCPAVSAPLAGYSRCEDGSFSAGGACVDAKNVKIVNNCASNKQTFCPGTGTCASSVEACPVYDGCPVNQFRCSDCVCRAQCTFTGAPLGLPFMCADNTWRATESECSCARHTKIIPQTIQASVTVRRRFVVRASALLNFTILGAASAQVLGIDMPQNYITDNNCNLVLSSAAESTIDAASAASGFIVSPVPILSIVANGTTPCMLLSTATFTLTFPTTEPVNASVPLTCVLPFGGSNSGSNVTVTTVAQPTGAPKCALMGSRIVNTAVAIATGAITVRVPVQPAPPIPSTSVPPSASATPAVSTTAVPSGVPGASTSAGPAPATSPASATVASSAIIAFVVAVLALLI